MKPTPLLIGPFFSWFAAGYHFGLCPKLLDITGTNLDIRQYPSGTIGLSIQRLHLYNAKPHAGLEDSRREANDIAIINALADRLNEKAMDV